MLLRGADGSELELSIMGYQFPQSQRDPWESNSLLISVRVLSPEGTWEVVDPCLTTWEAGLLVRWLAAVATVVAVTAVNDLGCWTVPVFRQPNLTVTARAGSSGDRVRLRATFELELRPPWAGSAARAGDLFVDLDVDRAQVAEAAASLSADLDRFPLRGDDPTL